MLLQSESVMSTTERGSVPYDLASVVKYTTQIPVFLETLYLFTANDFATFAIPTTLFATFGALSGPILTTNPSPSLVDVLQRVPLALAVVWANLLVFNISNQRTETAVEEDRINKPHRPLPSSRITCDGARRLLLVLIPVVLFCGWMTGTWQETLLLFAATWMYNDLCGSDENWILRNLLIAIGYGLYSSAALRIVTGSGHQFTAVGSRWIFIITALMFTTQHICDIKDAQGDKKRGRKSAPVVLGDGFVRWTVVVPVMLSSITCPWFFYLPLVCYTPTLALGLLITFRTLLYRTLASDKLTWKLWALWTCSVFTLPLLANLNVFVDAWIELKNIFCFGGECASTLNLVAVSGVALAVEGRRVLAKMGDAERNGTMVVPELRVEGILVG